MNAANVTTERPASQGPQQLQRRLARFNVFAAFKEMPDARHALESLGRHGFEGEMLSLHGPGPDLAGQRPDRAAADARVLKHWFATVAVWSAAGAFAGFLFGIPVGIIAIEAVLDRDLTFLGVLAGALLGALFIGTIAGLTATVWPVQAGDTWELTFLEGYPDTAVVGVHTADRAQAERALRVLSAEKPLDVRITGPHGRVQETAREMSSGQRA
jgi:hypothetical protein